jgi:hypothetical protein
MGPMNLRDNVGTIEIDGESRPALSYSRTSDIQDCTSFQVMAVSPDDVSLLWICCRDGLVRHVWIEDVAGGELDWEWAYGTCSTSDGPHSEAIAFPSVAFKPADPVIGFSIVGPAIALDRNGVGSIHVDSRTFELVPFTAVDCSECGGTGWRELHAAMIDWSARSLCTAIIYLDDPTFVSIGYALCLPELDNPFVATQFSASWSAP